MHPPTPKKKGISLLITIAFFSFLGIVLISFYRPQFHLAYNSDHGDDVEHQHHENNNENENNEPQKNLLENKISLLQQKLTSCEETVEMIAIGSNNFDANDNENIASSFCSSELFSNKCSGHGSCFDPLSDLKHQRKKKQKLLSEKEEQKKLVNNFGVSTVADRRHQQLRPGSCVCDEGFAGKDCSVDLRSSSSSSWSVSTKIISQEQAESLITLIVISDAASSFQETHNHDDDNAMHFDQKIKQLKRDAKHLEIITTKKTPASSSASSPSKSIEALNEAISQTILDDEQTHQNRPFLLILGPDVVDISNFDLWRANLPMMVDQMVTTDVDFLGMMTIEHRRQRRQNSPVTSSHDNSNNKIFDPYCYDLVYHAWRLRHKKAPFGYERHQGFTMFCERISNTFMIRKSMLKMPMKEKGRNKFSFFNKTLIGAASDKIWPVCSFHSSSSSSSCKLFDPFAGTSAWIDLFLRIKRVNMAISSSSSSHKTNNNNNNNLKFILGSCAECMIDIVDRNDFLEPLTPTFTERHQIEVYFDAFGRRSNIICTKSGGIYGHSNKGLYAPLCHRLMRQRDFLWLSNLWTSKNGVLSSSSKKQHHENNNNNKNNDEHEDEDYSEQQEFSISVHHGNLFGALRYQEELLWETDGDFDLICHHCSHSELMERFNKLVKIASANPSQTFVGDKNNNNNNHGIKIKGGGFETIMTYPEKPWYIAFKKEKTDFQLNARSPLSKQTRGKPLPQVHNVTVPYQGRHVHMNGFANPWRGIRSDPGHDYRDLYLAQQGWVLHFTKSSVSCSVEGHNACLPNCQRAQWFLFDHEYCSDVDDHNNNRGSIFQNVFDRDPILWFDQESDVMFRESIPPSRHVSVLGSGTNNNNNNNGNYVMNEEELFQVAKGETKKWMKTKLWQFL